MATDIDGVRQGRGGDKRRDAGRVDHQPGSAGYTEQEAFAGLRTAVTPRAAKALLEEAGVDAAVPDHLHLRSVRDAGQDRGGAEGGLGEGWLQGHARPAGRHLLRRHQPARQGRPMSCWAGWGADWPSAMTVLPPLFDSRPNFARDAGNVTNLVRTTATTRATSSRRSVDQAATAPDIDDPERPAPAGRHRAGERRRLHPAGHQKFYWLAARVTGFMTTPRPRRTRTSVRSASRSDRPC